MFYITELLPVKVITGAENLINFFYYVTTFYLTTDKQMSEFFIFVP